MLGGRPPLILHHKVATRRVARCSSDFIRVRRSCVVGVSCLVVVGSDGYVLCPPFSGIARLLISEGCGGRLRSEFYLWDSGGCLIERLAPRILITLAWEGNVRPLGSGTFLFVGCCFHVCRGQDLFRFSAFILRYSIRCSNVVDVLLFVRDLFRRLRVAVGYVARWLLLVLLKVYDTFRLFYGVFTSIYRFFVLIKVRVRVLTRLYCISIAFPFYDYELISYYGYYDDRTSYYRWYWSWAFRGACFLVIVPGGWFRSGAC